MFYWIKKSSYYMEEETITLNSKRRLVHDNKKTWDIHHINVLKWHKNLRIHDNYRSSKINLG